ncbi:class I poly(R)-hydroxyalkanoic acid synthase [Noviherbaspirillum denitrificans]|uniref:Class I poly(R)-hydroxyalkanoic acid synthase n=1 Tax=Noviherbaspirillum denitrificans TaxID=1968433 RepID=A0A254TBL4_9BURK|nr:class I poly(R)-hydroxyalkanoic acid synthase [Noviherbaspirillum denitrificans]OWW20031.1 class I poly(R)-hydroxyalkanoic acid synthase [Noviherbaspirillum denitrificans]
MNMFQPQSGATAEWMTQFVDPNAWQAWLIKKPPIDTKPLTNTVKEFGATIDPSVLAQLQSDYMQQMTTLWQEMLGSKTPAITDKRFAAPEWQSNPLHAFNAAAYLLNAKFLMSMADAVEATPRAKQKIRFAIQQMVDALSPANFLVSNPEALQKIVETKGESLTRGITNMLEDMQKGHISQTDESAFEVGRNVATSEGAVVFENELFQLIQYKPLTAKVYERPLLLVPPCINKYYILDLQPENSLVRYAVEQGHTVFLVSWCNPDESLAQAKWDDYILNGAVKAINVVQEISGQDQINALGFCVGGTIISTALSLLYGRGENPVASLTLLTTLLDFSDTGVIDVYIDEAQVALREQSIGKGGLMPGRDFASSFSSLRPNDLVWNYVKSNYLKGESPPPFDLLYWNADSTNLPGPMFCYYLRNMYLENNLRKPGKVTVAGEKIDLSKIDAPVFIYGSREDHIVPWGAAYESMSLLNPKKRSRNRFVLGASGHIAGVINPPAKKKRSYWTNDNASEGAKEWLAGATEHPGSWWPEWAAFLEANGGKQVTAPRKYGSTKYKEIEPAPGRYVKVKAE